MHLRIRFKPSLFQHVGKESSLKGKRQNLIVSYELTVTIRQAIIIIYLLTEWEGRTGKYLARGHGVWTECQIFSRSVQPNSVNEHFII